MTNQPDLEKASFEFSQESNCLSENQTEVLTIECQSSLGIDRDENCFYVLKTESWTIDSVQDIQNLIDRISKVINTSPKP